MEVDLAELLPDLGIFRVDLHIDQSDPMVAMSRERQLRSFELVRKLIQSDYAFTDKDGARDFFTRITGLYKNLNYAREGSPDHERLTKEIDELRSELAGLQAQLDYLMARQADDAIDTSGPLGSTMGNHSSSTSILER